MDLEDIASAIRLKFDELLTEIETIISAGTRLDLSYYIQQNVDDDKCEQLEEYFSTEAKSDSVKDALADLVDEDVTETEIRLVRIKFLSENGN
jgi:ATP-dependent DNA helicase RecQ